MLNLKQGLGAAARPAAAAARPKGPPPGLWGRRQAGGRREAKIRVFPKMPPEPPGGSGGSP